MLMSLVKTRLKRASLCQQSKWNVNHTQNFAVNKFKTTSTHVDNSIARNSIAIKLYEIAKCKGGFPFSAKCRAIDFCDRVSQLRMHNSDKFGKLSNRELLKKV